MDRMIPLIDRLRKSASCWGVELRRATVRRGLWETALPFDVESALLPERSRVRTIDLAAIFKIKVRPIDPAH